MRDAPRDGGEPVHDHTRETQFFGESRSSGRGLRLDGLDGRSISLDLPGDRTGDAFVVRCGLGKGRV